MMKYNDMTLSRLQGGGILSEQQSVTRCMGLSEWPDCSICQRPLAEISRGRRGQSNLSPISAYGSDFFYVVTCHSQARVIHFGSLDRPDLVWQINFITKVLGMAMSELFNTENLRCPVCRKVVEEVKVSPRPRPRGGGVDVRFTIRCHGQTCRILIDPDRLRGNYSGSAQRIQNLVNHRFAPSAYAERNSGPDLTRTRVMQVDESIRDEDKMVADGFCMEEEEARQTQRAQQQRQRELAQLEADLIDRVAIRDSILVERLTVEQLTERLQVERLRAEYSRLQQQLRERDAPAEQPHALEEERPWDRAIEVDE